MQIAVLLEIVAVYANVSLDFVGVCYLTIKAIEMNDDYCKALKNKESQSILEVLDVWDIDSFTIHMDEFPYRSFKVAQCVY